MIYRLIILAFITCLTSLTAQRSWTVNIHGGADFKDLPAAVAAASPGDTIYIDGHSLDYRAVSTSKGLTIISSVTWPKGLFTVHDLPKGQRFMIQDFTQRWVSEGPALHLRDNKGSVHLEACSMSSRGFGGSTRYLKIERCADVSINASFFEDLEIVDSRVRIVDSGIVSTEDIWAKAPQLGTAIIMTNSRVVLANTVVNGAPQNYSSIAAPGIRMTGGELVIAGWSKQAIVGGVGLLNSPPSIGPPIESNGGRVILDPDVWLLDRFANPAKVEGNSVYTSYNTPYVTNRVPVTPETIKPTIHHLPGSLASLVLGLPSQARPFLFGELWLDPSMMFSVGVGALTGSGTEGSLQFSFFRPAGLFPKDILLSYQAAVFHQGKLELSVPVQFGVR